MRQYKNEIDPVSRFFYSMAKKQKFYVVWKGREMGIFDSWADCSAQVSGYPGAEYKSFESREAAAQAFRNRYEDYKGKTVSSLTPERRREIGEPALDSYAVDAACSGYPGPVEYRGVYTKTKKELFRQGPYPHGSNNIGEFLALVHALDMLKQKSMTLPVYSDSAVAISWVKGKRCNTNVPRVAANAELFKLIERAEDWLAKNDYPNPILKWETEAWGEIPADFGRK